MDPVLEIPAAAAGKGGIEVSVFLEKIDYSNLFSIGKKRYGYCRKVGWIDANEHHQNTCAYVCIL